jgi:hypothetical protein
MLSDVMKKTLAFEIMQFLGCLPILANNANGIAAIFFCMIRSAGALAEPVF